MKNAIDQIDQLSTLATAITAATSGATTAFNILLVARINDTGMQLNDITIGRLTQIIRDAAIEYMAGATA